MVDLQRNGEGAIGSDGKHTSPAIVRDSPHGFCRVMIYVCSAYCMMFRAYGMC